MPHRIVLLLAAVLLAGCAGEPVPPHGIGVTKLRVGDDPDWARPAYDDSNWERGNWWEVETREVWWLRSEVALPPEATDAGVPLGLYVVAIGAAEVYWDGALIGVKGRPGATPESEESGPMVAVFPLPADVSGRHSLAIRFSAHLAAERVATPVDAIYIATYGSPLRSSRDLYLPSLIAGGALLLALGFLLLLWLRGPDPAAGWLALATLGAVAQLAAETSRAFILYDYTLHGTRLAAIGVAAIITGLGMLGFGFRRFGPDTRPLPWLAGYAALGIGIIVFANTGDQGTALIIAGWVLGSIALAGTGVRQHTAGARLALVGFVLLGLVLLVDLTGFLDRSFFMGLVAVLLLFFLEHVRTYVRTRMEREQARLKAARLELELAKRHIQPHFLLNTLTTLSELIETDPRRATRMIDALGDEFRLLNDVVSRDHIDLDEEIKLCRAHLAVMQLRYGAELELAVHGDTGELRLPPAVLHTLLENALTHNRYEDGPVRFALSVAPTDSGHTLRFSAPLGSATDRQVRGGQGLDYVNARLEEVYGPSCRATSRQTPNAWITELEIP